MYKTSAIINLISFKGTMISELASVIRNTLNERVFDQIFGRYLDMVNRGPFDLINFFITMNPLNGIFDREVTTHDGADMEDEFVSAIEIDGRVVLLLYSPDRGSQIRIQDDNYTIKEDEVINIVRVICQIINQNKSYDN